MEIPRVRLNTGYEMPIIGLGTWQLQGMECTRAVKRAIELGYKHIDTAEMYNNEEFIGEAIKEYERSNLFITSKVWPNHLSYEGVKKAFAESSKKLGTDYIDLYLIHWPKRDDDYSEALKAFKELNEEGKIRSFGVSNFSNELLDRIMQEAEGIGLKVSANQVKFHPLEYPEGILRHCSDKDVAVTAYSPLGRGAALNDSTIAGIAKSHSATSAAVALAWIMKKGVIAIPKASTQEHMLSNLDSLNLSLTDDEMAEIDALGK